jgi:hypothetical protein
MQSTPGEASIRPRPNAAPSHLLSPVSCLLSPGFSPNVENLSRGTPKIQSNDR